MAKYKFKQDFTASGTNIVPPMSKMANFQLKYNFKKGDVFEGNLSSEFAVTIETPNALNTNGTPFGGRARFGVPLDMLETVGAFSSTSNGTFWTPQVKVGLGLVAGVALLIVAIKFWK